MPTKTRVLFCGHEFADGYRHTLERASQRYPHLEITVCDRLDVQHHIADADVAVPLMTRLDAALIARGARGSLKLILQFGVGLEGIDIDAATRERVRVARIPSEKTGNAVSTAEMACYLTLAARRRCNQMADSVAERRLGTPTGAALLGSRVCIVGWGAIGRAVAVRLQAFGCALSAARASTWAEDGVSDRCGVILDEACVTSDDEGYKRILSRADVVCVCCTQDESNRGMIDATFLHSMKRGASLVNVARGGLFNRQDVLDALNSGQLGYLASDVAWSEPVDPNDALVNHANAYFTPHVGGVTHDSYKCMAEIVSRVGAAVADVEHMEHIDDWPMGVVETLDIQLVN